MRMGKSPLICGLMLATGISGQTFTTLHTFNAADGTAPVGPFILSGNTLYGTCSGGGVAGNGTVFKINIDGTGFTNLHDFTSAYSRNYTNNDGYTPSGGLIKSGNKLYGSARGGGSWGWGTVFAIDTDGTGFTILHNCRQTANDAANPSAGLLLVGTMLYGTSWRGGSFLEGTVFSLKTNGSGFKILHSFTAASDGATPTAPLILSGDTLYGTAWQGGTFGNGTVFAVKTNGTGFAILHSFTAFLPSPVPFPRVNEDGAEPESGLILSSNTLYGTAYYGGNSDSGTVFSLNIDGTGFNTLHSFTPLEALLGNSDGADPLGGLILTGNVLCGTATHGGMFNGTVFALNTDGTIFTTLHTFDRSFYSPDSDINRDGANPNGLILSGRTFYGSASGEGVSSNGTVFSLSIQPQLTLICSPPLVLECTNEGAVGTIEVGVTDSSTNPVVVVWTVDGMPFQTNEVQSAGVITLTNVTLTSNFGFGQHLVRASASNGETAPATCAATVQVRDTIPPQISSVSAMPNLLWPPNHQLVPVTIEVQATDNCGPTACRIVAVTSNEPADGDWVITGDLTVNLRAERLGQGRGRIYIILVQCDDVAGNSAFGSVNVTVPHNMPRGLGFRRD